MSITSFNEAMKDKRITGKNYFKRANDTAVYSHHLHL